MKTAMQELIEWCNQYEGQMISADQVVLHAYKLLEKEKEQIGQFMNWFIKHYSTATIDGMFGWVNSINEEVTLKEILDDYYNQTYNN